MKREDLFKKYYKHKEHDYEIGDTLQYKDDTGREIDIAFVYSGRNRGKSFEISSQAIADAYYDKKQFAYVRRHDATTYEVEQYFEDKKQFILDMTDGKSIGITKVKGKLFFYHIETDDNGDVRKVIDNECGYFFPLSTQAKFKSLQYPEVYNMIYEEVLTDENYLNAEPEKLMNLYSTLRRHKQNFRCWLISNLVSVVNPYSNSWGIHLAKVKAGEIKLSKLYLGTYDENGNEEYLLIGAHYLKDKAELTKEDIKKPRNRIKTGISSNKWDEIKLYPTITLSYMKRENYPILDTVVFEYDDLMFQGDIVEVPINLIQHYRDEEEPLKEKIPILYIRRKTSEPHKDTRLYTNNVDRFNEYTTRGFAQIYVIDEAVSNLYKRGWVFGADNLTMNDFSRIFLQLRGMKIGL